LLSFDPEWNFSRINVKGVTADILPHGRYKYNIFDAHLPSLGKGEGCPPFAQLRQRRNHPVVN
jgi:hypothetical protein